MQAFRAGKVGIVVYPPKGLEEEKAPDLLGTYLNGLLLGYPNGIGIIHQPETNPQIEEDKYFHLHFYATRETQTGAKWIEEIVSIIHCEPIQVSVEPIRNETGALRYLVHADDPQKIQYDPSLVKVRSKDALASFRKALEVKPTPTIAQILACTSKREVAELVGFKEYSKAIRVFMDLNEEAHNNAVVDVRIAEFAQRVERVYSYLSEMTAEKKYLLKGYIPFKEYQELLRYCLRELEEIHSLYKYDVAPDKFD